MAKPVPSSFGQRKAFHGHGRSGSRTSDEKSSGDKDTQGLESVSWADWKFSPRIVLTTATVQLAIQRLAAGKIEYKDVFAKFFGKDVFIPGAPIREFLRAHEDRYSRATSKDEHHTLRVDHTLLTFFATHLKSIHIKKDEAHIHFDLPVHLKFDGKEDRDAPHELTLPPVRLFVIDSKLKQDPYLCDDRNVVLQVMSDSPTFLVKRLVRLSLGPEGFTGTVDSDVQIRELLTLNVNVKSESNPGFVQPEYSTGKQLLYVDESGHPMVRNNHYVPRSTDYWITLGILYNKIYLSTPQLPKNQKP